MDCPTKQADSDPLPTIKRSTLERGLARAQKRGQSQPSPTVSMKIDTRPQGHLAEEFSPTVRWLSAAPSQRIPRDRIRGALAASKRFDTVRIHGTPAYTIIQRRTRALDQLITRSLD